MNRRKLEKIRADIEKLRKAAVKAADVEAIARKLGRRKGKSGKEPMWESELDDVYPLSIPHHGSRDLSPGVKKSILDHLEIDLEVWEQLLAADEDDDK